MKDWFRCRETFGAYNNIISELQLQDRYHNDLRWFALYFTFVNLYA